MGTSPVYQFPARSGEGQYAASAAQSQTGVMWSSTSAHNSATVLPCCRNPWKRLRINQGIMRKRVLLSATAGVILISLIAALIFWGRNESKEVRLADGRLFRIEAVTFGTNHVVGRGDGWLFPLWRILPTSVIQFLGHCSHGTGPDRVRGEATR